MARKKKIDQNKWVQPEQPPPPMFLGKKERDLTKQVNDELIERVIGQTVIYFPVNVKNSNFHPLYGEAITKTFLRPIIIKALIKIDQDETTTEIYGLDKNAKIVINFHKRRLTEDQDLYVREGDIVFYGMTFYEIVKLSEPRPLFGQVEHKMEIQATCVRVREGFFNEPIAALQIREKYRQTQENILDIIENTEVTGACEGKIQLISGKRTSSQRAQFLDYVNNPQKYEGCIVYLTEIDEDEILGDFDQVDKFYFNEDGAWFVSQFFAL
jgi:transposase